MTNLWGGRFEAAASDLLRRFNDSFAFDRELFAVDVEGSIAWARALEKAGVLTRDEASRMVDALARIGASGLGPQASGPLPGSAEARGPRPEDSYEDIHSYVETQLRAHIGDLAGKLHTGRSRNDQVATDLKLWLKQTCAELDGNLVAMARTLAQRALDEAATPMPGYTHSKRAEPVTFGHWSLAYVEMLRRDLSRLRDTVERNDSCPLGSGALSGTPLNIDREALAKSLGFARATANSLDAVSDRDFAAEYLFAAAMLLSHLSRLAEDLIFFTSDEVAFAELPDAMATGSSRMPQKKNPDVLELVRGHAGRSIGELTGLLALLKGLPLAYDKDLQLDKEPLFRTRAVLALAIPALTELFANLKLDRERMRTAASHDLLLATEVADAMAARGIPFRKAHEIVSARIGEAIRQKKTLRELGATSEITDLDLAALDVEKALTKRNAHGGTSPERVKEAARKALESFDASA
ncbi:MAG TPA: argininosuccinate lyase [Thermoanaerobaculia bacterium]|nr:argininosuccinate lyase [Thermoanaerobaculia bacterium]